MKLKCVSCDLRLNTQHFRKSKKLYSICDLCRIRGLEPENYANYANSLYAEVTALNYIGAVHQSTGNKIAIGTKERKTIEKIIAGYDDSSVVVKKNLSRRSLAMKLLAYEDHQITIDDVGNFFDNLTQLGFQVQNLHDLQKIEYPLRMLIYNKYHNTCQYCGRKGYSIDHMIPVSRGGSNDLSNLTLSCQECNKLKSDMPYEWFVEFNLQTRTINQKLVEFEKQIEQLQNQKDDHTRKLNAYMHRTGLKIDDQTNNYRQQIKTQQMLIDGLNSDYHNLRELRKNYINTRYQMYKLEKRSE